MEHILPGIALLLSLLSFYVSRSKASKRVLQEIHLRNSELQQKLDQLQRQVGNIQKRPIPETSTRPQAKVTSNEISTLKAEVACIRQEMQAQSQKLSAQSQILESFNEKEYALDTGKEAPVEKFWQELSPFKEPDRSTEVDTHFAALSSVTWSGVKKPTQDRPLKEFSSIQESSAPPPVPYEQVVRQYQDAIDRGDRKALRQLCFKELNITSESEDSLVRRSSGQATKLEAVQGGGSYMVVSVEERYWLFPTAQTLDSFSMNQPQKGIFDYEREILSKPVVKKPAEVKEVRDAWIVIAQGMISVPG